MEKQIDISTLGKEELSELNNSILMQIGSLEASKQQLLQNLFSVNAYLQNIIRNEEAAKNTENIKLPKLKNINLPKFNTQESPNATT